MTNLNLVFNKLYYDKLGTPAFKQAISFWNNILVNTSFNTDADYKKPAYPCSSFDLQIKYPGLLIGTGNPHGTGTEKIEINSGFSFDYVTGQPYIPATSVKGMLRSCFRLYPDVVRHYSNSDEIDALEKEIFDFSNDVFFDAVIKKGNSSGKILGFDYITPHKSATTEPVPIHLLKLLPDVTMEFRFSLTSGILSEHDKLSLFKTLISLFGIGAKTNVGYGVLSEK